MNPKRGNKWKTYLGRIISKKRISEQINIENKSPNDTKNKISGVATTRISNKTISKSANKGNCLKLNLEQFYLLNVFS